MLPQVITVIATLLGVGLGSFLTLRVNMRLQDRAAAATRRQRVTDLSGELMSAILQLESELSVHRTRWTGWSAQLPLIAAIGAGALAEQRGTAQRLAGAFSAIGQWQQKRDDVEHLTLVPILTKVTTVVIQISLLGDDDLAGAADAVYEAVRDRTNSIGRKDAARGIDALNRRVAEFRIVAVRLGQAEAKTIPSESREISESASR